jgi:hypothetical protein
MIVFAFVFGMRYGVGTDHLSYIDNFLDASHGIEIKSELIFKWITYFFARNGFHYVLYFSFLSFIQILFLYLAFKNERYLLPFLVFILFTGGYFLGWMNVIRQNIVVCIFIYAIKFIKEKKIISYFLFVLLGFFIHKSALILIVFYPLLINEKDFFKSRILQLVLFTFALVMKGFDKWLIYLEKIDSIILIFGYDNYSYKYIENETIKAGTNIGFWIFILIDVIIILYSRKLKNFFKSTNFLIFYNLYFVGRILSLLFLGSIVLQRPFLYLTSMKLIIASYLLYYLWIYFKRSINGVVFFTIIFCYLLLFIALIYRGESNMAQFVFFWQAT